MPPSLSKLLRDNYELIAVHIDLGIHRHSLKNHDQKVRLRESSISIRERYGSIDRETARKVKRLPCSICGPIKPRL